MFDEGGSPSSPVCREPEPGTEIRNLFYSVLRCLVPRRQSFGASN